MTELNEKLEAEARVARGTWGFDKPDRKMYGVVVVHVLTDGRLIVGDRYGCSIITDRKDFRPSRDAYYCIGSYADLAWEGETARCKNTWSEKFGGPKVNQAENLYTDEEAIRVYRVGSDVQG